MKKLALWLLVGMFALASASFAGDFKFQLLRWDNAADTTWSLTGTAADTSQPFKVTPDMSLQHIFNSGTTTDSIKMNTFVQYNLGTRDEINTAPATSDGGWTYTVAGVDSLGYMLTADSTAGTAIIDCSTDSPVRWGRLVITGITGNRLSAGVTGQTRVLFYK